MRITLINQFYVPDISPTAHLSASLADGLAGLGHEVTVITSRGGYVAPAKTDAAETANPRIYRVWTPQLGKKSILKRCIDYASFYLLAAARMVRLPAQDVIISLTTPPFIAWTGVFHRMLHPGTKLVLWNMDCYPDAAELAGVLKRGGLASRCMRAMNRALFSRLDHLICLDPAMRDLLVPQYAPRPTRPRGALPVAIIPNWERASFFPPQSQEEKGQERPAELAGKFVILYMGNTGVGHPFEAVVEAAKRLKERGVVFLFVGGGKRWKWLHEAKARENLENLLLWDYVAKEKTRGIMMSADCALITLDSKMAGVMSPSKLHANLAMGLPVIYVGPERSNVDEAVKRFDCGVSLRDGDVEGIVRFIERLLESPKERGAYRQRARGAFEAAYCDARTLPAFCEILETLAPGGRLRPAQITR